MRIAKTLFAFVLRLAYRHIGVLIALLFAVTFVALSGFEDPKGPAEGICPVRTMPAAVACTIAEQRHQELLAGLRRHKNHAN